MNRKCFWGLPALLVAGLSTQAAEADRYLPADTEQVVVFNVKQIDAPLFKKYVLPDVQKNLKANRDYKQLQEATGLDVFKDVDSVVIANSGTTGKKALLIVRGQFNQDKIHETVAAVAKNEKEKVKITKAGERNLYEATGKDGQTVFATFIDNGTIVASPDRDMVTAAADGKGGKISKDLVAALETADAKQSIWMAGLVPAEATRALGQDEKGPAQAMKKIKSGSAGITVTKSISVSGLVSTGEADAARAVAKEVDGAKNLLTFFAATNEQVKPFAEEVLRTLKIKTNKGDVTVSFSLSEELSKQAAEMIPRPEKKD